MERRLMLRMDISTLRLPELRNLLATARARGQDALAEQIEAEIAARADGGTAKPAPPTLDGDEVLPIGFEPTPEEFELQLTAIRRRPARRWPIGLAVAGVLATGAALGWGLAGAPGLPSDQGGRPAPAAAAPIQPRPQPRAMTVRTDPAAPPVTAEPDARDAPEPEPEPEPPIVTKAEPARDRPLRLDPCATPPSPADRLLCNDLALNLLDHEMRAAYGRAMEAGADPVALRESQSAWRRSRDPTADARALAGLYDRRIRELEAAAAPPSP